ncbi:MAG: protein-L-isoaspartate(D-aspartate) O-methyltransferase [Notoacmeibacter sp.]
MKLTLSDREGFAAFILRARAAGINNASLFSAIEAIPRRAFVPPMAANLAYGARSIPIDCGETLEGLDLQAKMISYLNVDAKCRVLEVGTGSGFTGALLGALSARVVSIDRYHRLAEAARLRIEQLTIKNVVIRQEDATALDANAGTFDRIISWSAFETLPRQFLDLISANGVMVTPVGASETVQRIVRLTKIGSRFEREDLGEGRFTTIQGGLAAFL